MTSHLQSKLLCMALALGACGQTESGLKAIRHHGQIDAQGPQLNGLQLNGLQLNGLQLNGLQLNGLQLNGLQLNGLQLNGLQLNGLQLNGTLFSANVNDEPFPIVAGTDLSGATFDVMMTDGNLQSQLTVKIDAISSDSLSTASDVYLYDLTYQLAGSSSWTSVCKDASGGAVPAIPIANYWNMSTGARIDDPSSVTFACVNGALGKCVRWGYRPWASGTQCSDGTCTEVSLKDYHQACTRMVRADYCGSGVGHTVDGTPIDVFDSLAPQIQSRVTNWKVEAKWTPHGATCLGKTRQEDLFKQDRYPDCNGNHEQDDIPKCKGDASYELLMPNLIGSSYNS